MVLGINLGSVFLQPLGLYALLSAIPLILLYLIRPKPQRQSIPSLMFFLKNQGVEQENSFFKTFSRDWLFWIQLLTLIALSTAVAKPYINVPEAELADNVVIVLDVSASMQASDRFDNAVETAVDALGETNTVILARNNPAVVKQEVGKREAQRFLENLKPGATSTAIYDATRAAIEYAGENTKVVVLSDFIETKVDNDVSTAARALQAQGAVVELEAFTSGDHNIGITDLVVKERKTTAKVRNYYPEAKQVPISVNNVEDTLNITPGSSEVFTFTTPTGVNKVTIDSDDAFPLDDTAHISTPKKTSLDVLFITNDAGVKKSNLWIAFQAIDDTSKYNITIETVTPPENVKVDHDIIILDEFSTEKILPGVFADITERVKAGGSLIITAQQDLFNVEALQNLLPVTYNGAKTEETDVTVAQPPIQRLTKNVDFGTVDYYHKTTAKDGTRAIATTEGENNTIIGLAQRGKGNILYYGIFDHDVSVQGDTKQSTFKKDLYYPIFWKRAVDVMTNTPSVKTLNKQTGSLVQPDGKARTPEGKVVTGSFLLDRQGIYHFGGQSIAANLIHAEESDIAASFKTNRSDTDVAKSTTEKPKPLTQHAIILAGLLLFGELLYTKYRGDM